MYLRGLFDGEGSCSLGYYGEKRIENSTPTIRRVSVTNTDADIIEMACRCLTICGIEYSRRERRLPSGKLAVTLDIHGRRDFVLFRRYVGFASGEKAAKLKAILASYKRRGMRAGDRWVLDYPKVRKMRASGMKYREISDVLGIPMGSICKALGSLPQETRAALTERACQRANCARLFLPPRPQRRYCSPQCAQLEWAVKQRTRRRLAVAQRRLHG